MKLKGYAAVTQQGPFLDVNEDGYDFDLDQQFFQVYDGFGGSGIGDRAVDTLKSEVRGFLQRLGQDPEATMPLYWNPRWLVEGNALINALLNAHNNLHRANSTKGIHLRAGASMTCALKADDVLVLGHVGNCRAYLVRHGSTAPLFISDSHSFLGADSLSPKALHVPASAMGMFPELTWSMREVRVREGDVFVFLTEGVAPWITDEELAHYVINGEQDLQQRLNVLLKLSNERGNASNQTGMILEF